MMEQHGFQTIFPSDFGPVAVPGGASRLLQTPKNENNFMTGKVFGKGSTRALSWARAKIFPTGDTVYLWGSDGSGEGRCGR